MIRQGLGPERIHLEHRRHRLVGERRIGGHIHGSPRRVGYSVTAATGREEENKGDSCKVLGRHGVPPWF